MLKRLGGIFVCASSLVACSSIGPASTVSVADNLTLFAPPSSQSPADIRAAEEVRLCAVTKARASWPEERFARFSRSLSIYATSQVAEIRKRGPYLVTEEFLRLDVEPNSPAPPPEKPNPALFNDLIAVGAFVTECEAELGVQIG